MPIDLSVQLYSLREQMKDGNHLPYLKKLADLGYKGVECAGLYGLKPREYKKLIEDHGMKVSGNHAGLPEAGKEQEVIELTRELGLQHAIVPWQPPENFASADAVKKFAERMEKARQVLEKGGVTLGYHNHDFEMQRIDGEPALLLLAKLVPKLQFEIDVYWAANHGAEDPAKVVAQLKDRTPFLHLKDGPLVKGAPMVAVGSGKQNMPAIIKAANPAVTKWVIVELDACAGDMYQAVEDSYHYLVGNGLAAGNKPAKAAKKS
jgi:sugar phosphate isomerase/epimerase